LDKITKIEENRKAALASLNIKYASADKVKTSFGFIGFTFLGALWGLIILNDLAKLLNECYKETKDLLEERREKMERKQDQVKITLEKDETNSQNLEEKLEKIHMRLVRACASRRENYMETLNQI
jgi:cell division protein ZapA (FtsZ GTPase activity inhibitor)